MALGGGGNVLGLIFKIKADGTEQTKQDIRSLRAEFNKDLADIKSSGTDSFLSIGKAAGFSTESIAGFKTGALAAVGAITAITAAITSATIALFGLTKQASDYGSEIWNAHLKTGFSIQSIQAFKQAGEQADVQLQQTSTGLIRFTNNLAEADAGNKKMLATMSNVGIKTFKDSDAALREFLTHVANLKTEQEKVAAFSSVFGARMGGTFNQLFEQMGYDVDGFLRTMQEDGRLLTDEQVKMADAFGDLYKQVSQQLRALGYQVGNELMPIFGGFMLAISNDLKSNQSDWKFWGNIIENVVAGVLVAVMGMAKFIHEAVGSVAGIIRTTFDLFSGPIGVADLFLRIFGPGGAFDRAGAELALSMEGFKQGFGGGPESGGKMDFNLPDRTGKTRTKKDNSAKQALDAEMSELKDSIRQRESVYSEETTRLKSEHDQQLSSFEELMTAERNAADARLHDVIASIEEEEKALNDARAKGIIKEAEYLSKSTGLQKDKTVATNQRLKEESKLEAEEYKRKIDLERRYYDESRALADKQATDRIDDLGKVRDLLLQDADWQIGNDEQRIKKQLEIELAYNEQVNQIRLERLDEQERRLNEEVRLIAEHYAEVKGLSIEEAFASEVVIEAGKERAQKLIALEYERSRITKETTDANIKAYRDEARAMFDAQNAAAQGASRLRTVGPGGQNPFKALMDSINSGQFTSGLKVAANGVRQFASVSEVAFSAVGSVVNGLAQGVGDLIQQWVTLGDVGPHAVRKMVASVLAGLASQAAVQALMFLAYGIAALTPWGAAIYGPAAPWFKAAAIMGAVAVTAGVAGRLVAGDSFQSGSGTGSSSGAGSSGGSSSVSDKNKLPDISVGRFQAVPTVVHLDVNVKRDAGSIVDVVTRDYQNNGPLRQLVVKDGVTARS